MYPDAATRDALHQAARGVLMATHGRGRAISAERLHLTLAFLGDLTAEQERAACAAADQICGEPFRLDVDHAASFKSSGVWWLGCRSIPATLAALRQQLAEQLRAQGLALDRKPFAPHITILRDAGEPLARKSALPVTWPVGDFALLRSPLDLTRGYELVRRWPIRAPAAPAQASLF